MGINLGDAALYFIGDATQLNQAFDSVEASAVEKLQPAQVEAQKLADELNNAGVAATKMAGDTATGSAETSAALGKTQQEAAKTATVWTELARANQAVAKATYQNELAQAQLNKALERSITAAQDDTTVLDELARAQQSVQQTAIQMAEAEKVANLAAQQLQEGTLAAGEAALRMGAEYQEAGTQVEFSMAEAKGSLALISEETGVNIPRHLRGFISNLGAVGPALEAAFEGIAIFVIIQLIVEATEKLTEFVGETFIYTEAAKEQYKAEVELNNALLEHNKTIEKLKSSYELLGLEGAARTKKEFEQLTDEVHKTEAALRDASNVITRDQLGLGDANGTAYTEAQVEEAKRRKVLLGKVLEEQQHEQAALSRNFDLETLSELQSAGLAQVSAFKTIQEAKIEVLVATSRLRLAQEKADYFKAGEEQTRFYEQRYQADLKAAQDQLAILQKDPLKNVNEIKAKHAEIEKLEADHQAHIYDLTAAAFEKLRALLAKPLTTESSNLADDIIPLSEIGQRVAEVTRLLDSLGIKGVEYYREQKEAAVAAYTTIQAAERDGLATKAEVLAAQMKIVEADIHMRQQLGEPWTVQKKQLEELQKEYGKVTGAEDKATAAGKRWADFWKKEGAAAAKPIKTVTDLAKDAFLQMVDAFQQAIVAAETGSEGFGQAMLKATAVILANVSAQAAVLALFEVAKGFAALANPFTAWQAPGHFHAAAIFGIVAAVAGAGAYGLSQATKGPDQGETAGAPAGAKPIETTGAAQAEPEPAQSTNVQRFARGGFVTQPTMAIIGDSISGAGSSREPIIPIDDDRATSAIADAIGPKIGGGRQAFEVHLHGGLISADTLADFVKLLNHGVTKQGLHLKATTAFRTEKR
jgi:hypothetical protein